MKVAIVTAIFGNYDSFKEQHVDGADLVDWYCFTDNLTVDKSKIQWKIINRPYHLENTKGNAGINAFGNITCPRVYNMMCAKYYKIQTHAIDILKDYDYYIWIDGSIFLRQEFVTLMMRMLYHYQPSTLVSFKHSARSSVHAEFLESVNMNKYRAQPLTQQYQAYVNEKFPDNLGLFENTVMIKKNCDLVNKAFDMWWEHNLQYSYQDQISLPFIIWKSGLKRPMLIEENVFNNKRLTYTTRETYNHW
jgi:hypothetical protein